MEKIHGNTHVFVLSCKFLTCKHKDMHVSMYFLHLELTFTPHYIITNKGLLRSIPNSCLLWVKLDRANLCLHVLTVSSSP